MVIDPGQWRHMAPFAGGGGGGAGAAWGYATGGAQRPISNTQGAAAQNAANQAYAQAQTTGVAQPSNSQNPHDWMAAFIEQERYRRQESDKQFQVQMEGLKNQRDQIAISRGQAEANAWYQRETVNLSARKLAEDQRQFDVSTGEAKRQFDLKQSELIRQFDVTTAEGKRQFDLASAESTRQFDATFGQRVKEFEQDLGFRREQLGEGARQYDLSRSDQREQFALQYGLDIRRVEEAARQYDLTRADDRERFLADMAEQQRQFDVGATGYMPGGQATLEREKFQNQALMDWTDRAIALASQPADWIKYKQQTMGVAANAASIPGLSWTQGEQQGNTAFAGEAQPNSLQNVQAQMGVGQQPGQRMPGYSGAPPGDVPLAGGAMGAPDQRMVSPGGSTPGDVPLSGGSMAPGAQTPGQQQPLTNWASQAAGMVPTGDALRASLSEPERQVYDTANEFSKNPQQAGFGFMESMDPMTQQLLKGASQAQGHDWASVMARHNRSRWGGGGSARAA